MRTPLRAPAPVNIEETNIRSRGRHEQDDGGIPTSAHDASEHGASRPSCHDARRPAHDSRANATDGPPGRFGAGAAACHTSWRNDGDAAWRERDGSNGRTAAWRANGWNAGADGRAEYAGWNAECACYEPLEPSGAVGASAANDAAAK